MGAPSPHVILTVGHSSHEADTFVQLLVMHHVVALVDVRSVPRSRFAPQFNRDRLSPALKAQGIRYAFLGGVLGGRSNLPEDYDDDGRVSYPGLARRQEFQEAAARLVANSERYRLALMCVEREPLECHRALLVGQSLHALGQPVAHIHGDGELEMHADALNRLLGVTGIPERDLFRSHDELVAEALGRQARRVAYVDEGFARRKERMGR